MTLPQHRILCHTLLASPGDELTRLALADLAEEKGIDLECLRQPGHWEVTWDRESHCWWLQWVARWSKPCQWYGKKPIAFTSMGGVFGVFGVCSLSQKELPRCVGCGKRAHRADQSDWLWWCCDPVHVRKGHLEEVV